MSDAIRNIRDDRTRDFAEACYDGNTIEQLEDTTFSPDEFDMKDWGLTAEQWHEAVNAALADLKADQADEEE